MKDKLLSLLKKYRSLIMYAIFGVLTTLINIITYHVTFNVLHIDNVISTCIAWVLSVLFAFVTNKLWVFDSRSMKKEVVLHELKTFFSCRLLTGLLDVVIMYLSVDVLHLHALLWKVISNVLVIILNYVASKLVIFRKDEPAEGDLSRKKVDRPLIQRLIGWGFTVVMLLTVVAILLCQDWTFACKQTFLWDHKLSMLCGALVYIIVAVIAWLVTMKVKNARIMRWIMLALTLVSVVFIYYGAVHYAIRAGWDVTVMHNNAEKLALGATDMIEYDYYYIHPNNTLLTWIYSFFYALTQEGGPELTYWVLLACQSLVYGMAVYGTWLCGEKIFGSRSHTYPLIAYIIGMVLIGASPWVVIPYSDGVALIMVPWILFCYLKLREHRHLPLWLFLFTFLSMVGYNIKPQCVILLIAAAAVGVFEGIKFLKAGKLAKVDPQRMTAIILCAALGLCGGYTLNKAAAANTGFGGDGQGRYGIAHYLMMGLNTEDMGAYSDPDMAYSMTFATNKERDAENLRIARERLNQMGPSGLAELMVRKLLTNYADGTFGWYQEGMFVGDFYYWQGSDWKVNALYNDIYLIQENEFGEIEQGAYYEYFKQIMQVLWLGTLLFCVFAYGRRSDSSTAVMMLAILGLTLFELLFEARARYLFAYVPVYLLLACAGLEQIKGMVTRTLRGK